MSVSGPKVLVAEGLMLIAEVSLYPHTPHLPSAAKVIKKQLISHPFSRIFVYECVLIRNLFRNSLPAVCVEVGVERSVGVIVIVIACNKAVSYNFHHKS